MHYPTAALVALCIQCGNAACQAADDQRQQEKLDRGVVAVRQNDGSVWVSWRLLKSDPADIAFRVMRVSISKDSGPETEVSKLIEDVTWYVDRDPIGDQISYSVIPEIAGKPQEIAPSNYLYKDQPPRPYLTIPLKTPEGYGPNDASVGDLDGDGQYEIVLHQASGGKDNSQPGLTGEPILQAYTLAGKMLWQINLGRNIREGAHYTQFMVYDLDGDGRAEVACKTADGTVDGTGQVIGDAAVDHRNEKGYVLRGPEFLTIFDGKTGRALATTDYVPARGDVSAWGDDYGNRVDRFLAGVAFLDGKRPSLVMCRGYYTRVAIAAWNWRDEQLTNIWTFDTDAGTEYERRQKREYRGQGDHALSIADVDSDGRDEIIYGGCVIDDDGRGLYSTKLGHGDALHVSDLDPTRLGLEIFNVHEKVKHDHGVSFRDARSGEILWSKKCPDVPRGLALDIDPRHPGSECWAIGEGLKGLWNAKGETISDRRPRSCNFGVYWDGDLQRELLDRTSINKWDWETSSEKPLLRAEGCASNNGSKSNPALSADILGDWREEVIFRSADNRELRIYTTTIPTKYRFVTLMQDSQYRLSIAWQNVGYNQPAHLSFVLGEKR